MGNCSLCPKIDDDASTYSTVEDGPYVAPKIDKRLKFCLLGTGDSGKSTLFKQMKINYVKDYSKETLIGVKPEIIRAFVLAFFEFANSIRKMNKESLGDEMLDKKYVTLFPDSKPNPQITDEQKEFIRHLWESEKGKTVWENRSDYQVPDSFEYFCEDLDRICDSAYEPTEKDYLRCRSSTTGIIEQSFQYRDVLLTVVDVGGQRSERRKWFIAIDKAHGIFYVVAISEFNQKLFEENHTRRYDESIEQFKKTAKSYWFKETVIILLLNKVDLFHEKVNRIKEKGGDFDEYFPELGIGTDYENCEEKIKEHIELQFTKDAQHKIFPHFITAIDQDAFKLVFQAATQIILSNAVLDHFGEP